MSKKSPRAFSKMLKKLESCETIIHSHKRDYHDNLRMLHTNELSGINSKQVLKDVLYSYDKILESIKDCKLTVVKYQKEGEDE